MQVLITQKFIRVSLLTAVLALILSAGAYAAGQHAGHDQVAAEDALFAGADLEQGHQHGDEHADGAELVPVHSRARGAELLQPEDEQGSGHQRM